MATTGVCIFIPNMVTKGFALPFLAVFLINHLMKIKRRGEILRTTEAQRCQEAMVKKLRRLCNKIVSLEM